jgi:hypothetical protein
MTTTPREPAPTVETTFLHVLRTCALVDGVLHLRGATTTLFQGRIATFRGWMIGFAPASVPTYSLDAATFEALQRATPLRDGSVQIEGKRYELRPACEGARAAVLEDPTDEAP